jgi:hypothetical protein
VWLYWSYAVCFNIKPNISIFNFGFSLTFAQSYRYWDELADISDMAASELFKPEYFGGNGVGNTTRCIIDGPFVNTSLAFGINSGSKNAAGGYCIYRDFDQDTFQFNAQNYVDQCMAIADYTDAWDVSLLYRPGFSVVFRAYPIADFKL